ncbi:purine catabolism regulator [Granulicella aggregans]|uniref:Purine catabolism regulator n=1 Tax=Granulicella aggregans TaxID=474949 RepID=A0A7W7ZAH6_9BACT|nr:PucR family transcriptional regulator [Granulicella aggregans]MBB5056331.1 purine catabolism regulator [Granulicella aggregans]
MNANRASLERQPVAIDSNTRGTFRQGTALPSLETLLNLPAFRSAELICGGAQIDQPVTWVHVSEIMDIWRFLSGGELLLSTGLELMRVSSATRRGYIRGLSKAGIRALGLELVQWITEVPSELLETARELNFPIVVFRTEVSFRELTRAAHQEILRPTPSHGLETTLDTILNSLIETGRDRQFLQRELGPLLSLPPRPRTTLLITLEALLDAQFNIAAASRNLGVRRQSVYYRLDQLTGLLGSLDDPSRKLGFLVAFALLRSSHPQLTATERPTSRTEKERRP